MRTILTGIVTAALLVTVAGGAKAQGVGQWVELGCQRVGFQTDRDVVKVGVRDGAFRAIRLRARGNDVYMMDLRVVYGNGQADNLPLRMQIRAGAMTGALDLKGFDRYIDRIDMVYRSKPNFRGEAVICIDGLVGAAAQRPAVVVAPPPPRWVMLGCQRVGFRVDRDVVQVGPQAGTFRAIRLVVRGNDVFMRDLKVVYGNGAADDLPVRALVKAGTSTGALDLKGDRRAISRVGMVYQARPDFNGGAEVCVEGAP